MSRKESKKNKLNDFHKAQLENHRAIFAGVEPIITQDGKDQEYQNDIKVKKENKIRYFITKLFGVSHKSSKKVVADKRSGKPDQNNNLETYDAIEEKIKQMSSKEVLQFLNRDEIQPSETSDKGNVKVNIEEQIKNMDSKQILEFLNRDSLEGNKIQDKQDTAIDVENKIKHMNSTEILQFLNADDLSNKKIVSANELTTKGKVAVERKEAVSWVSTITQSKSNQDRSK